MTEQYYIIFNLGNRKQTLRLFAHRSFWVCSGENFHKMTDSDNYTTGNSALEAFKKFIWEYRFHEWNQPDLVSTPKIYQNLDRAF
jgi:hypothetical protein